MPPAPPPARNLHACGPNQDAGPPTLSSLPGGPKRLVLVVLGTEGGGWNGGSSGLMRDLVRARASRAPPEQRSQDGRADGGAYCQSRCNKQWRGRRLARPPARRGRGVLQPDAGQGVGARS